MRAFLLLLALAACGRSKCEKYADMEWKCGHFPANEKDMTLQMAQGFCAAADSDKAMARFGKEADCATKFTTCEDYKKCTGAVPLE